MPSVTGNGATLGYRCTGCSMGAGDSFYLDIRQERNFRSKALLSAGHFDHMICRILISRQSEMYRLSICFDPIAAFAFGHLVIQCHLGQRFPVTKYHAPSVQISRHISFIIFNKQSVMKNVYGTERIVTGKHIRRKSVLPYDNLPIRLFIEISLYAPSCTGLKIIHLLRSLDHHFPVSEGLITDHMCRILSPHNRTHTLSVYSLMYPYSGTRCCHRCSLIYGFKGFLCCSLISIIRLRMVAIYVQLSFIHSGYFPKGKATAIRQNSCFIHHFLLQSIGKISS